MGKIIVTSIDGKLKKIDAVIDENTYNACYLDPSDKLMKVIPQGEYLTYDKWREISKVIYDRAVKVAQAQINLKKEIDRN